MKILEKYVKQKLSRSILSIPNKKSTEWIKGIILTF